MSAPLPYKRESIMALSEELSAKILALLAEEEEGAGEQGTEASSGATPPEKETSSMRAVREQAKRLERELKKREEELASLREYKETAESKQKADMLLASGLSPRQSEVFLKAYDAVTEENVADFKASVLGAAEGGDAGGETQRFAPTGWAGERADKPLTPAQLREIQAKNPAEAARLVREGKVAFRSLQQ
jgi:hypothetical protein